MNAGIRQLCCWLSLAMALALSTPAVVAQPSQQALIRPLQLATPFPAICNYCIAIRDIYIRTVESPPGKRQLRREDLTEEGLFQFLPAIPAYKGRPAKPNRLAPFAPNSAAHCAFYGSGIWATYGVHKVSLVDKQNSPAAAICWGVELVPEGAKESWREVVEEGSVCMGSLLRLPNFYFVQPKTNQRMLGGFVDSSKQASAWTEDSKPPSDLAPGPVQTVCDGELKRIDDVMRELQKLRDSTPAASDTQLVPTTGVK